MRGAKHGSECTTENVTVRVTPRYLPEQSDPSEPRYVFGYHIDVRNNASEGIQILSRRWLIIESDGEAHEVEGEGVIGLTPHIAPGESFHYASYCPIRTEWGTMEGAYIARWDSGRQTELTVARFYLAVPRSDGSG